MPKFLAEPDDANQIGRRLRESEDLDHLRTRRHADLVIIESGPLDDPFPHARLRRVGVHLWRLEMPTHIGRWQPTHLRGQRDQVLSALIDDFGWTLSKVL